MLYYDRIDLNERNDVAKSTNSIIWFFNQFWFLNHGFKFQDSVCNGYQDLTMLCLNISDIAIITIKGVDYRSIIHSISKSEAIRLLENSVHEYCGYIKDACQRNQLFVSDFWHGVINLNKPST